MSTTTTDITTTVDTYIAIWNERDPDARRQLLTTALTDDITYVDPLLEGAGIDALDTMVAGTQKQWGDAVLRRTSDVDQHHDRVRFNWDAVNPSGQQVIAGIDFCVVAPDGRLQSITGFFDLMPEL